MNDTYYIFILHLSNLPISQQRRELERESHLECIYN